MHCTWVLVYTIYSTKTTLTKNRRQSEEVVFPGLFVTQQFSDACPSISPALYARCGLAALVKPLIVRRKKKSIAFLSTAIPKRLRNGFEKGKQCTTLSLRYPGVYPTLGIYFACGLVNIPLHARYILVFLLLLLLKKINRTCCKFFGVHVHGMVRSPNVQVCNSDAFYFTVKTLKNGWRLSRGQHLLLLISFFFLIILQVYKVLVIYWRYVCTRWHKATYMCCVIQYITISAQVGWGSLATFGHVQVITTWMLRLFEFSQVVDHSLCLRHSDVEGKILEYPLEPLDGAFDLGWT